MSKSLKRVQRFLLDSGVSAEIVETSGSARTAAEAAQEAGCHIDQIAKSIIFRGETSNSVILFITAGGNQVESAKASAIAGEPLGKANAELIRSQTGFAIGGVAPVAHLNPIVAFWDNRLSEFDVIWAAAGTPRHIFPIAPDTLLNLTGATPADFLG